METERQNFPLSSDSSQKYYKSTIDFKIMPNSPLNCMNSLTKNNTNKVNKIQRDLGENKKMIDSISQKMGLSLNYIKLEIENVF